VARDAEPVFGKRREQHRDQQRHDEDTRQRQCIREIHALSNFRFPHSASGQQRVRPRFLSECRSR
jgi:hypothetical protein